MRKGAMSIKLVVLILSFLFAMWLPFVGYVHYVGTRAGKNLAGTTWVTGKEIRHLMKFHGTNALKITGDRVFIWRNGRWIPVLERGRG